MAASKKIFSHNGVTMLPARRAAQRLDVAPDYIGKLCREGKLECSREGNSWFVAERSLAAFARSRETAKQERSSELAAQRRTEQETYRKTAGLSPALKPVVRNPELSALLKKIQSSQGRAVGAVLGVVLLLATVALAGARIVPGQLSVAPERAELGAALAQIHSPFFSTAVVPVSVEADAEARVSSLFSKIIAFFFGEEEMGTNYAQVPSQQIVATTTTVTEYNTFPVVERVVERVGAAGDWVPVDVLTVLLGELHRSLRADITRIVGDSIEGSVRTISSGGGGGLSLSDLTDANIPDTITASNYLPLTGGTLTGALDNSSSATSTFVGGIAAARFDASATSTFAGIRLTNLDCSTFNNDGKLTTDASGNIICDDDTSGVGAGTPGGSAGDVQYNDGVGGFAAEAAFDYNATDNRLSVVYASTTGITASYASTTQLVASSFNLGGSTFTSLLGAGLINSGGVLTVSDTAFLSLSNYFASSSPGHITSLPNLSITESQISDLGNYLENAVTAVGPAGQTQTGPTVTFATSSDTNIGLTIVGATNTLTFTPTWSGTLAATRGGTGLGSVTQNELLIGAAGNTWTQVSTTSLGLPTFADIFAYPFPSNATSTTLTFSGGLLSTASTTITNLTTVNATSTNATTTSFAITGLANSLLSTNAQGTVIATTSVGANYITGLLGTINNTAFNRGDSITITAASSTLLTDNNTFSGANTLSSTTLSGNTLLSTATSTNFYTSTFGINNEYITDLTGTGLTISGGALRVNDAVFLSLANYFASSSPGHITSLPNLTITESQISDLDHYTDTDANAFIHASTTIPKTYTANTFTALQTFNAGVTANALTVGSLTGPLQAVSGAVSATSTLSVAYGGTGTSTPGAWGDVLVWNGSNWQGRATSTLGITGNGSVSFGTDNQIPFTNAGATDFDYASGFTFDGTLFSAPQILATGSTTLQNFTFTNATGTSATTTNLAILGITDDLLKTNADGSVVPAVAGVDYLVNAVTAVGPAGQTQTGPAVTFATSSDTNIGLTITGAGNTISFASTWTGTLADARVADDLTISGGTINNTPIGASSASTAVFTNATTTGNLAVLGVASTTSFYGAGLTSCADPEDKLVWDNGLFICDTDAGAGGGITSIGPAGQTQTGPAVTLATSTSAFNGLTANLVITGSLNTLTFTSSLAGSLGDGGVDNNLTLDGGTINNTPIGASTPSTGAFTTLTASNATTTTLAVTTVASTSALVVSGTANTNSLTIAGLSGGGSQCLEVDSSGVVSATGVGCGTGSGESQWELFNGVGVRLATTTNRVLIGATATSSQAQLEVITAGTVAAYFNGSVGIGTSSPMALLSVHAQAGETRSLLFAIASSTASATTTHFAVTNTGNVGLGTSTPWAKLSVLGGNISQLASGNPTLASSTATGGTANDVYVSGNVAYVAAGGNGLRLYEISNPASPRLLGSYTGISNTQAVAVSGRYAYTVDATAGLTILDVSNTASPTVVGSLAFSNSYNIALSGRYAYVSGYNDGVVRIVDVADPASPRLAGTYTAGGSARGIAVTGRYAYVAITDASVIEVVDISNPAAPSQIDSYSHSSIEFPWAVYVSGGYLYVADLTQGFSIVNITNPATLTFVGAYNPGSPIHVDVAVAGRYAYVLDDSGEMLVLDVVNPASPSLVGSYSAGNISTALYVSGKHAYLAAGSAGLHIVDINGAELPAANIGSLAANTGNFSDSLNVGQNIYAGSGLSVGLAGINSRGDIAGTGSGIFGTRVGIGTTSPTARLSIHANTGDSFAENLLLIASSTASGTTTLFSVGSNGLTTAQNILALGSSTLQNFTAQQATTTHLYTSTFGINSEYITDLTGNGLAITGGALRVNDAVFLSLANYFASSSPGHITSLPNLTITESQISDLDHYTDTDANAFIHASTTIPKTYTANTYSALQSFADILATGSTTLQNFTFLNATGTAATTTNLAVTGSATTTRLYGAGLATCNGLTDKLVWSGGLFGCAIDQAGSGSGSGSWATTTSQTPGILVNYSSNATDVVAIGSNSTTTAEYWFDPNTTTAYLAGRVGIGLTSPGTALDVLGTASSTNLFVHSTATTTNLAISGLTNALLSTNALGQVVSTTSVGANYITGLLGTINNTAFNRGDSITITAASSTLLTDNNAFSGANTLSSTTLSGNTLLSNATSTNLYTSNFGLNSEYITDLTGNGLTISSGALSVSTTSLASGFFLQNGNSFGSLATLGTNDANALAFETGGTEYARLTTEGRFGIGTTTPGWLLQVAAEEALPAIALTDTNAADNQKHWVISNLGDGEFAIGQVTDDLSSGSTALYIQTNSINNFGIFSSFTNNTSGSQNIALGFEALFSNTEGENNIGIGANVLELNTGGSHNIALGFEALTANVSGSRNIALGQETLQAVEGSNNVAIGTLALQDLDTGDSNIAIGENAFQDLGSGLRNIAIGYESGTSQTTGDRNIVIGVNVQLASTTGSNQLNIGNLIYGNSLDGEFSTVSSGNIGIGSSTPYARLSVQAHAGQSNPVFQVASSSGGPAFLSVAADGFGTTTLSGLNISGSATSTSNVGFNVTGGCYAINGTCLGGSSYGDSNANAFIHASTTIPKTYTTNTFTALQTFNAGVTTNALTVGSLTGPLQAIAGVVSATSTLSVAYGGTGLSTLPTFGQLLVGQANGTYALTATSSLGLIGEQYRDWQIANGALTPTTTLGILVTASSTIGNGTQTGGLTISGGATTTGNAYFGGRVGVGTAAPADPLTVLTDAGGQGLNLLRIDGTAGWQMGVNNDGSLLVYRGANTLTWRVDSGGDFLLEPNSDLTLENGSVAIGGTGSDFDIFLGSAGAAIFNEQAQNSDFRIEGQSNTHLFFTDASTNNVAVGTSSPYSRLTIWGGTSGNILEAVTNASSTALSVSATGFGTTTLTGLTINGSATSTSNVGFDITDGCYAVDGVCVGSGSSITFGTDNQIPFTNAGGTDFEYASSLTFDGTFLSAPKFNAAAATSSVLTLNGADLLLASTTNGSVSLGLSAGLNLVATGLRNVALGNFALQNATSTADNVALGYGALTGSASFNTGVKNIAIGTQSLFSNTSGGGNIGIGYQALALNTTGSTSVAVGNSALRNNSTGNSNSALGFSALNANTTGSNNTAVGYQALVTAQTAINNTAVGYAALNAATNGWNTGLGSGALFSNNSGWGNVGVGYLAGQNITTGFGNIALGTETFFPSATDNRQLNIGNLIFGTLPATTTGFNLPTSGTIGIGTTSPTARFGIALNNGDTLTTAFQISSSTAAATTTLFSISNTGSTTIANGVNIEAGCFAISGVCLDTSGGITFGYPFPNNATSTTLTFSGGLLSTASTTIGNGTATGGLTISGGATTTGDAYFAGIVNVGVLPEDLDIQSELNVFAEEGVAGISLRQTAVDAEASIGVGTGGLNIFTSFSHPIVFGTTDTQRLTLSAAGGLSLGNSYSSVDAGVNNFIVEGKVGIGSSTPFAKLSIHANNGDTATSLFQIASSTASATTTLFNISNSGQVQIGTDASLNNSPFTVVSSDATLSLRNTSSSAYTGVNMFNDAGTLTGSFQIGGSGVGGGLANNLFIGARQASGQLIFVQGAGATEIARFNASGNLGLGTTSPGTLLSLGDTGANTINISATATSTFGTGIDIRSGCFAINGVCVGGGSASLTGSTGQVAYFSGTDTAVGTSTLFISSASKVGIGTTTPRGQLSIGGTFTAPATERIGGIDQIFTYSMTGGGTQIGNNLYIYNSPATNADTLVGSFIRVEDTTALSNTVRGLEVQTNRGSNTQGENTAISGTARTFGVRAITEGDAGGVAIPAGLFAQTRGTTQGNAIRAYSSTVTTADALVSIIHDTSTFSGTGLLMNLANGSGTFNGNLLDLQVNDVSRFTVASTGVVNIHGNAAYQQNGQTILQASTTLQSIFVGQNAGDSVTSASSYNTLVGYNAGTNITSGAHNTILGSFSTAANSNLTTGSNNISIGYNISLPSATANNQLNIGNILYGTSIDGTALTPSTGRIGIGTSSPYARLSIQANNGEVNTMLFAIASSTASATTTLFSISNTGLAYLFGSLGIGTTSPGSKLSVTDTATQVAIAYDGARFATLRVDSVGDLTIAAQGQDTFFNDDNLWVCTGGSCPAGSPAGTGNLIVENNVGIGTSTPASLLTIEAQNGTDHLLRVATTTNQNIFTIDAGGYVGIGTSSPTEQLTVQDLIFVGANGQTGLGVATSTFYGDIRIVGKLDVGTIDPVYTIDGTKYATYGHSTIGIKEEVVTALVVDRMDEDGKYRTTIRFKELEEGSDLWLFYQITSFGEEWEKLVVSLTAGFEGVVSYQKVPEENALTIVSTEPGEVSMRLVADRFDATQWPNLRPDQDDPYTNFELQSKK